MSHRATHGQNRVTVEAMQLDDIPSVLAIDQLSFPLPWSASSYRYELTQNKNSYFVVALARDPARRAALNGGWLAGLAGWLKGEDAPAVGSARPVVGYAGFWYIVDEAHISTIAVHPDWRGRGVGERVLAGLLERALDLGATAATLEVRLTNTPAQNLYRKYAFEVVGRRKRYYRDNGEDALLMTAALPAGYREFLRRQLAERRANGRRPAERPAAPKTQGNR